MALRALARLPVALSVASALVLAWASPASAYTISSSLTEGCHENISISALRELRADGGLGPSLVPNENDRALIDDLPFPLDADIKELAAASFLVGIRDNDLKGRGPMEVDQLATVHGDPNAQREHCLRSENDDEPDGSASALENCKTFIREKIGAALDGLDANGLPDPTKLTDIAVHLELRGRVTAKLPLFWVSLGQAVHAVQDSFTHSFRTDDRMQVRTSLNWVDYVNGDEVEARDGPVHRSDLDKCSSLDDLRTRNLATANAATREFLRNALDPKLDRATKLANVDQLLVKYLSYAPGCTDANGWCNAPENSYAIASSCGCSTVGTGTRGVWAVVGFGIAGAALVLRERRRRAIRGRALGALALLGATLAAEEARADEPGATAAETKPDPPAEEPKPTTEAEAVAKAKPTKGEVEEEKIEAVKRASRWGIYAAFSGSVTNPSVNGQLGGRFRLSERWLVGLDGELNGWYGDTTKKLRTGAFNGYATLIMRTPLRFAPFNLRTTANLGFSTMLIDLYGAPRGSTGIFAGLVPLGLEWKVSRLFYVVLDPLGIALPVPQLKGVPFAYPQYRAALGIELAL